MYPGFLLELKDADRRTVTEWVSGAPEKSFWRGISTKDRMVYPVTVYRCERCGFLEGYALPPATS